MTLICNLGRVLFLPGFGQNVIFALQKEFWYVLAHSGCYNKIPRWRCWQIWCPAKACFPVHRWSSFCCVLTWQKRDNGALWGLFHWGLHSHDLSTSQRPYLQILSPWALEFQHEFWGWGDTNIQPRADVSSFSVLYNNLSTIQILRSLES